MNSTRCLLVVLTVLSCLTPCSAETFYIRDTLYVQVREGPGDKQIILHKGLRSGTQVERVEVNEASGFSRIRTDKGLEGWVKSQYLVKQPIAAVRLREVTATLHSLEAEYQQAQSIMQKQSKINDTSSDQIVALEKKTETLNEELSRITKLAASTIAIDQQNEELESERDFLFRRIDELSERMHVLKDTSDRTWFLLGAGSILLGLLFGFWVGRKIYFQQGRGWN